MSVPQNKEELLLAIENSYKKLEIELKNIPVELSSIKNLEGHAKNTQMSVTNLVAYLIGWGELVLKWNYKKEHQEQVDFPETNYKWNELGKLAQKFYIDYEDLTYEQLLLKLSQTVNRIVNLVQNSSNETLYQKPWYNKWPKGKMIQFNTSSPYKNAYKRIRKWKKENIINK